MTSRIWHWDKSVCYWHVQSPCLQVSLDSLPGAIHLGCFNIAASGRDKKTGGTEKTVAGRIDWDFIISFSGKILAGFD